MSTTQSTADIVRLLDRDHRQVEEMLERTGSASGERRDDLFCELVHLLVSHEVAEEVVVYPAIREDAPNGDAEADARIKEQSEAEELLARMEKLDATSTEFDAPFAQLRSAVLAHAQAEEQQIFPLLEAVESPDTRVELGSRYERAKATAPTHPHPHAPDTPPGNKLLGPVAAMFDKARDAAKRS